MKNILAAGIGFVVGYFLWHGNFAPLSGAAFVCDNDGTAEAGETCSTCPYDVRCTTAQKCIAGACSAASWSCKREDICGDGWKTSLEQCDDGGVCTGSNSASLNGVHCFDLDPLGNTIAGVARCRAAGGVCIAQNNDGCTRDCTLECHPDGAPCLLAADCCGNACVNSLCAGGSGSCGNDIIEPGETCDDGNTISGDGCSSTCQAERQCNDLADNDADTKIDCSDTECLSASDWVEYELDVTKSNNVASLRIGDLNADGEVDIVLVEGGGGFFGNEGILKWYESNGAVPPVFSEHSMGAVGAVSVDVGLVNDDDAYVDIVSATGLFSSVDWYKNNGNETFTHYQISTLPSGQSVLGVYVVDWNNDGQKDVLVFMTLGPSPVSVHLFENNGSESFTEKILVSSIVVNAAHFGDVNGDGRIDLIIGDADSIDWYRNQATLPFPFGGAVDGTLNTVTSLYAVNMDTDTDTDLVANDATGVRWYQNNGAGSFTRKADLVDSTRLYLHVADIDEDTDMDVIGGAGAIADAFYSTGGANPTFSSAQVIESVSATNYIYFQAGDLKNNGDTVVVAGIMENGSADNYIQWYDDVGAGQCYYLDNDESS